MNKSEAQKRIKKLRKLVEYYREQYHVYDRSEISDAALDSLKKELYDLEQEFPELQTADSPTQRVSGKPLEKFKKVKHGKPVLSLQDAFSYEDFLDYEKRITNMLGKTKLDYYAELKFDGLTMVLTYENGLLVTGATRGDGRVGENVTQNLKTIESIPLSIKTKPGWPKMIEVRGEVVMTKKEFARVNRIQKKKGEPEYANPRNTAAGSIRQLDSTVTDARNLDFFAFEMMSDLGQTTHTKVHKMLAEMGFKTGKSNAYCKDAAAVRKYLKMWEDRRKKLDYETDGVVIVVDSIDSERELGSVGKAERWMLAYKFPAEQTTTIIEDIHLQVGRTGAITPVAIMKPVKVAGSTVSRATLHNEDRIKELDVRLGDTVVLQKAGDVIPEVVEVLKKLRPKGAVKYTFPKICPVCGSKVVRKKGEAAHVCTNPKCYAQERRKLMYFISKAAFDIEGFGPAIVDQLIENKLVAEPADFFKLQSGDLSPLERLGDKSEQNLIEAVDDRRKITFTRLINSLGISFVGEETSADIAQFILDKKVWAASNPLAAAVKKLQDTDIEQLAAIEGVGEKVAKSIVNFLNDAQNKNMIEHLLEQDIALERPVAVSEKSGISGKTFVLTGSLETIPRSLAKEKIKRAGGKVASAVSASTDYMVAGDKPGSKFKKAQELGLNIISEDEFLKLLK
ncbi:NAD-dependent DNA ligase LigA [Patescibacteria group bacterium]